MASNKFDRVKRGVVQYKAYRLEKDGAKTLIEESNCHNTIVDANKDIILSLLASADANKKINKVGFGTDTAAVQTSDTINSFTDLFIKNLNVTREVDTINNKVTFYWSLLAFEYNGYTVGSIGLVTADGTLIAKKLLTTPIVKESDIILEGSWILEI